MAGTGLTGFLENLTGGELVIIALVALVVLGPERLPEMARSAGKMLHKVRTMTEGVQSEVRDVMADPSMQPLKELGELAVRPRQKLAEYALEAEAEERAKKEAQQAAAAELAADDTDDGPTDDATEDPGPADAEREVPASDHPAEQTEPAGPAGSQDPG
jgi:sec-independent protein translocase protein TatB